MPNLYISKIKLASGNEYLIKDAEARDLIETLSSGTIFVGVTTTQITDGSTTRTITVSGKSHTAARGDIVIYNTSEFIWDGTKWNQFGDVANLGNLAYHDIEDIEISAVETKDSVLGANTTFTNGASTVTFASGAGSNFVTGYNNDAVAPSFTEGAFTPASIGSGFYTAGTAASYSHTGFSGGSLGDASTGNFATQGVVAAMGTGNDAETLIFSSASTSAAVTAQGTYTPAVYGTDNFTPNTPTVINTSKFSGGSKAADSFSAGSAATLAKAKALTASSTGTAAAQTITVGTNDLVNAVTDISVSIDYNS